MAIIRKAPNGELKSFVDGTTEPEIQAEFAKPEAACHA